MVRLCGSWGSVHSRRSKHTTDDRSSSISKNLSERSNPSTTTGGISLDFPDQQPPDAHTGPSPRSLSVCSAPSEGSPVFHPAYEPITSPNTTVQSQTTTVIADNTTSCESQTVMQHQESSESLQRRPSWTNVMNGRWSVSRKSLPRSSMQTRSPSGISTSHPTMPQKDMEEVEGLTPENQHFFLEALQKSFYFPVTWTAGPKIENARVAYKFIPGSTELWMHTEVLLEDCTIAEAIALTNEVSQWQTWHATVTKLIHVGTPTKYHHFVQGFMSIALGILKVDFVGELHRFLFNGMVVEILYPTDPKDTEHYVEPRGKRSLIETYTMYIPTNDGGVVLIARVNFDLLFRCPEWLINKILTFAIPVTIKNFRKVIKMVQNDKKPFKKLMAADVTGIYKSLYVMAGRPDFDEFKLTQWNDRSSAQRIIDKYLQFAREEEPSEPPFLGEV